MKCFKLKIEEEWSPTPKSRKLKSLVVFDGTLYAINMLLLVKEQLAFRYFSGKLPSFLEMDLLDFDPNIDKEVRYPTSRARWCRFSFVPPNQPGKCVIVEAFRK